MLIRKLIEDGKKFALRGTPRLENQKTKYIQKTQYKADPSWARTSSQFLPFARKVWNEHTSVVIQSSPQKQNSTSTDEHFIKQIHAALNIKVDEFGTPIGISKKKTTPFGLIIQSARFEGPCEDKQVSTFDQDGKLIKALNIPLGCDCPSECEDCFDFSSIKWIDSTHFSVRNEKVEVIKQLADDQCETKKSVTEVKYEIHSNGLIKSK